MNKSYMEFVFIYSSQKNWNRATVQDELRNIIYLYQSK